MNQIDSAPNIDNPNVGETLRYWRQTRGLSQMQLALNAGTSSRHLSCVETGRAQPARELLLQLAEVLQIPLRTRNSLLYAAGFTPHFPGTGLTGAEMAEVNVVIEKILLAHQPYPAMVLDKNFNILLWNQGFDYLVKHFVSDASILVERPWNMLRLLFHPLGWADQISNLEENYLVNMSRASRALLQNPHAEELRDLMAELAGYRPNEHKVWLDNKGYSSPQLILSVHYQKEKAEVDIYTTAASLGSPDNISLQELHVEAGYPIDEKGEAFFRGVHQSKYSDQLFR